jgi:two-component system sensor histidine kinase UhpB
MRENSLGLQGIRERAALFNGTLTIETQPNQGTSLFIVMPYPENPV